MTKATLAEKADATDLKSVRRNPVRVRPSQVAPVPHVQHPLVRECRGFILSGGMSIPYIARKSGVSTTTLYKLRKRGNCNSLSSTLTMIGRVFGKKLRWE